MMASWRRGGMLVATWLLAGCGGAPAPGSLPWPAGAQNGSVVDVEQTTPKSQSIGNCWLYATAGWAESLHLTATGEQLNLSESYWTYWNLFDQIVASPGNTRIETGGFFSTARDIILRYGWMLEGNFLPDEATLDKSLRQATALAELQASMTSGVLSTPEARADRVRVRMELDRVWGLSPEVSAAMTERFGEDVGRTFDQGRVASSERSPIRPPAELITAEPSRLGEQVTWTTLDASVKAWAELPYPWYGDSARREWQKRIQRALHDGQPVIVTWFVDFNSWTASGRFTDVPATPGSQGYHMTVLDDYEVTDVPGFGTLPAGVVEKRPEALEAALADSARMVLLRTKNSWGTVNVGREYVQGSPGYHDLYFAYLDGPVKQCRTKDDGSTNPEDCPWQVTPLVNAILPAGY